MDWTNGPLDYWTIFWTIFGPFFGLIFGLFSKPEKKKKVIFRVGILFIYGAEEGGNGKMKMAPKQWQDWYIAAT